VENPWVMGILNITPDSFYEGSRFREKDDLLEAAEKMVRDEADILDIGGQSSRPGAKRISINEELDRVTGAIHAIHQEFPETLISIDSFYSAVAKAAVQAGASIINDISGGKIDDQMLNTAASLQTPFVCMHMRGDPENMQENIHYENIVLEILDFFIERIAACKVAGINDIILDPGFGFGKTIQDNFHLLGKLEMFTMLGFPLLAGLSRKSTVYRTLGIKADEALNGSTVLHTVALLKAVKILRVHDVKEAKEAVKLIMAYQQ
jgi:dihydropteroate synthase